jgi:tetratricopeptide (TPR) repeat protein
MAFGFWRTWRLASTALVAFGLAWFVIALAPTSSLIPFAEIVNEHRQFLPFIGLVPAATWAAVRLVAAPTFTASAPRPAGTGRVVGLAALAVIVLAANAAGTWQRNKVWRSEETLWLDVTQKSPANGRGLMNYGLTKMQQGDLETARQYFEKATVFNPNYSTLFINLGVVYGALKQPVVAETHFQRALSLSDDADSRYYYGRWLAGAGRGPEAADHFRRALAASPGRIDVRVSLLRLLAAADDAEGLEALARETVALDPQQVEAAAYLRGESPCGTPTVDLALRAGMNALGANRNEEAAECFRQMLRLDPVSADGWINRGWAQLQLGFVPQSVNSFHRALTASPSHERAKNNLVLAQQRLNR